MLVRRFLQPEQFQTEEMRNMVRYLQGLTERQARHSERVRTMQELLCRLLARHRVRLSRLDRDLVRRVVQQRALSRLIDEAAACSGAKEAEALLSRVRKLAAALPLRSGRRRKQGR